MAQFADLTIDDVIDNFSLFDSWEDKYTYLMDLGKKLPPTNTISFGSTFSSISPFGYLTPKSLSF